MDANKAHQKGLRADEISYRWRPYGPHTTQGEWTLWARSRQISSVYDLWDVARYIGDMRAAESKET